MAMDVLHLAGGPWMDLTGVMLEAMAEGRAVLWISESGTRQLFAWPRGGEIIRVRYGAPDSTQLGDGLPLVVLRGFFGTTCGNGDGSGYRSTPPLMVALLDSTEDVGPAIAEATALAGRLRAEGVVAFEEVPEGHPDRPCGAAYCPMITPEAVTSTPEGA